MKPDNLAILRYNLCGRSINYDYEPMIFYTQTDTTLFVDTKNRNLEYNAERHTDSIDHKTLGSIFHLADFGDVDISNLEDGSFLTYRKDANCGSGCEGINNSWFAWNPLSNISTSLEYIMGFDADGKGQNLSIPTNASQYYLAGWNAEDKFSYTQPVEVVTPPKDSTGHAHLLFEDPTTHQILKCSVTIGDDGTIKVANI